MFELLILLIGAFVRRLSKNSSNSSKPPFTDKNRNRGSKNDLRSKKPGGQNGHEGFRLEQVENPDEIENIEIDRRTIPSGKHKDVGFEARQVVDFIISKVVTEYRAQVLQDKFGNQYVASFPSYVNSTLANFNLQLGYFFPAINAFRCQPLCQHIHQ